MTTNSCLISTLPLDERTAGGIWENREPQSVAQRVPRREGAASALLALGAARSDVLAIKLLCALGVCARALREHPSPTKLMQSLATAAPRKLLQYLWAAEVPESPAVPESLRTPSGKQLRHWAARKASTSLRLRWALGRRGEPSAEDDDFLGGATAVHVAAFTLQEVALEVMLRAAPDAVHHTDLLGRRPLHYAAAGSDRHLGLVYLFTPQPFRTWLQERSRSSISFAPSQQLSNLTAELQEAELVQPRPSCHATASESRERVGWEERWRNRLEV